ncbi:MAG TPA: hypothetical protein VF550_10485 [Polyangia bacterium]
MPFGLEPSARKCRYSLVELAALGVLGLTTCHPAGFELKGSTYHSTHFDYLFHADDTTVCPDVMDSLEQHETVLAGYLGIDEGTLPHVTYFKLRDANEYDARKNSVAGAGANAGPRFVVSPLPFDEHELTHTITLGAWGESARFLEEGIAVALSCDGAAVEVSNQPYRDWVPLNDTIPYESNPAYIALNSNNTYPTIGQLYDVDATGGAGYSAAGAVTTYLIDTVGADKFRQLWASVSPSTSETDFSEALKNIYGFSLDEIWQTLQMTRHRPCAPIWMCSLPPIGNHEQGMLRSTCTGKDLGRPTSGNLRLQYPPFTHEVYEMFTCGVDSKCTFAVTGVSLIPCDGNAVNYLPRDPEMQSRTMQADTWIPPLAIPNVVTLETLAWVLTSLQSTYNLPGGQISYQTQPLQPATTRCLDAIANVIPRNTTSALWLPNDSQTHFARFQLDVNTRGDLYFDVSAYDSAPGLPPPRGLNVLLCTGCDGDEASNCNGCPFGTTDCIVRFQNTATMPLWLRIVAGDYWHSSQWLAMDAGTLDSEVGTTSESGDPDAGMPDSPVDAR